MKPDFSTLEKEQKLYSLLKSQHEAELIEMNHYMTILSRVSNSLIRNYFYTLLNDGLRHIEYLAKMMADVEGSTSRAAFLLKRDSPNPLRRKKIQKRCY
jgi:rubrerythrin